MSQVINYKIILVGDPSAGKTCLFKKLGTGRFSYNNISTLGIDRRTFDIEIIDNKKEKKMIKVTLLDTAGQERYRSLAKSYIKSSQGIFLMYDVQDRNSFNNVEIWFDIITENLGNIKDSKYVVILIGNKSDLIDNYHNERAVTEEDAKMLCEKLNLIWGGEITVKDMSQDELKKFLQSYVKQIYDKVGDLKQKEVKLDKNNKSKKRNIFVEL